MLNTKTDRWLSAHLYYNEPWETFLVNAVVPFADTVIKTGAAQQFFFIRYWDRGPHVRLRFKAKTDVINTILLPNLQEHFSTYFEQCPSFRTEPNYPETFPPHYQWYANNSVQLIDYSGEADRFGGLIGLEISEQQFQLSSITTLKAIAARHRLWTYDDALAHAIRLHLCFAHAVGFKIAEAIQFFDMIYQNWLPRTIPLLKEKLTDEAYDQELEDVRKMFLRTWLFQKKPLLKHHRFFWEALEDGSITEQAIYADWVTGNKTIRRQLEGAFEHGQLQERSEKYSYKHQNVPNKLLWSLYSDYVHMTNNRLGILNKDESFLAFLIMKSLTELQREQALETVHSNRQMS